MCLEGFKLCYIRRLLFECPEHPSDSLLCSRLFTCLTSMENEILLALLTGFLTLLVDRRVSQSLRVDSLRATSFVTLMKPLLGDVDQQCLAIRRKFSPPPIDIFKISYLIWRHWWIPQLHNLTASNTENRNAALPVFLRFPTAPGDFATL